MERDFEDRERHGSAPAHDVDAPDCRRSDERLREDICERLMRRGEDIDASEVTVEVEEGVVTLHGAVPERRMKHDIESIVGDCAGVKDIDNRLRVTYGEHATVHAEQASHGDQTALSIGMQGAAGNSGLGDASPAGAAPD